MARICPVCTTENPDPAKFCMACAFHFPEDVKIYDAFISYRRETGSYIATAIREMLESRFKRHIFLDVSELQIGRFDESLLSRIEQTPNFILILSRGSLDRCVEKNDWLKREVMHALAHNRNIIPVMMEDFAWPDENMLALLPDAMRVLPSFQAIVYSHVHHEAAVMKIAESLRREAPLPPPKPPLVVGTSGPALRPQILRDGKPPQSAFLYGTDGVITEVPADQMKIRIGQPGPSWAIAQAQELIAELRFENDINISLADAVTIEVVRVEAGAPARLRVTRSNGSIHEGNLRDKHARLGTYWQINQSLGISGSDTPFQRLQRIEFGGVHGNACRLEKRAKWGKAKISAIAFSPDGRRLATASPGGPLLFDVPDLAERSFVDLQETPPGYSSPLYVSVSADNSLLVSHEWRCVGQGHGWVRELRMRRLADGSVSHEWQNTDRVCFSPTSAILAAVEEPSKQTIKLYSARDGQAVFTLKGHTGEITALRFSGDGRQLASASLDDTVRIWDVEKGKCAQKLLDSPRWIQAVAWAADARVFVGVSNYSLMVWSCDDWTLKLDLSLPFAARTRGRGPARAVAGHPSRPWIAVADHEGILIWNHETGVFDAIHEHGPEVIDIAFNQDGLLAAATGDGCIQLWDVV
jgi:WD40 repeat protein